jgi:hypothetical protein
VNRWAREYRWAIFWLLVGAVLLLLLLLEWGGLSWQRRAVLRLVAATPVQTAQQTVENAPGFSMPGLESYLQMVDRPLFMDGRKPGVEAGPTPAPEQMVPQASVQTVKLMGVIIMPGTQLALLSDDHNHYKRVRIGEIFGGWTLLAVFPDHVQMGHGAENKELKLLKPQQNSSGNPGAPSAPSPVPAFGQAPPRPLLSQPDTNP